MGTPSDAALSKRERSRPGSGAFQDAWAVPGWRRLSPPAISTRGGARIPSCAMVSGEPTPPPQDVPERFQVDFTGLALLGNYRVEKRLAEGGMGAVYLAQDANLEMRVVVKVPHARF